MDKNFRTKMDTLSDKSADILLDYFNGTITGSEMVRHAVKMISEGAKLHIRDQITEQVKRSQAIRLITFIPKEQREKYIAKTNPETRPFLLPRPR